MDLDRITHPLRLAKGSHQPGSGKGCAMNVISYINGDTHITDFPECSARPLAAFVQVCNDLLAGPDGYLSPENSLLALELGWQTVGTADVDDVVMHAWVAESANQPHMGCSSLREARCSLREKRCGQGGLGHRRIAPRGRRRRHAIHPHVEGRRSGRARRLPRLQTDDPRRWPVCPASRIPFDRTRGRRPSGNAGCRNRKCPAGPRACDGGHHVNPDRRTDAPCDPLMA